MLQDGGIFSITGDTIESVTIINDTTLRFVVNDTTFNMTVGGVAGGGSGSVTSVGLSFPVQW